MNPRKPYYAVIFTSQVHPEAEGYKEMALRMEELAKVQPGYLGFESARGELGISISYWDSLEAISRWKSHAEHQIAQEKGKTEWYKWYRIRVCEVQRDYEFGGNS